MTKPVRIFISSPGDVEDERERARRVVETLRRRYEGKLQLKSLLWEYLPLQPDMSFQDGIDLVLSEKGVDIAVFILWSRMGSPTGAFRSGTESEFHLMMQAREQSLAETGAPRPDILVYTRDDDAGFYERLRGKPKEELEESLEQKRLVETFICEEFTDSSSGANMRAYHSFRSLPDVRQAAPRTLGTTAR